MIEDFNDFFEHTICGFAITTGDGKIIRANRVLAGWVKCAPPDLEGRRIADLLNIGGKIYYETHLAPLLKIQGHFEEIALELQFGTSAKMPVLLNAYERRDEAGSCLFRRFTFVKATDRRIYEDNLKESKASLEISLANALHVNTLREQLIAILGHDLRNPLGSIITGAGMLEQSSLRPQEEKIVEIIRRSGVRMSELITNIMDFARTRLGEGIIVNRQPTDLQPILQQVADEISTVYPGRIETNFHFRGTVFCDGPRIAQLFSNLLANAITHGMKDGKVFIEGFCNEDNFELSVCNAGKKIPEGQLPRLFEPFTREAHSPSQNGLGLGLYISAQIAKAHKGELTAISTDEQTCFRLRLNQA